ncbi:hypothetical protein F0562_013389 [Nyssa sinensis]|uniref:Uncharacterized protein n=1 Tax=Nyssa sinensis TaxID=561372 RepID=A0A5J4ZNB8_9ASTE|nr:hypothetical protein F0562_013389 [Nyssa sinensis]
MPTFCGKPDNSEEIEELAARGMKFINRFANCELRSLVLVDRSVIGSDSSTTNYPGKIPCGPDHPIQSTFPQLKFEVYYFNPDIARSLPIYVGGVSPLAVLFNRTASGIAPVADASSPQSKADLLTLGLAVTNILAGLFSSYNGDHRILKLSGLRYGYKV